MNPSLPTLDHLKANKTAFQLVLHLLAEWNSIEIQRIIQGRELIANVSTLWMRLKKTHPELDRIWRSVIKSFNDDLSASWESATSLREQYEASLATTLSHLNPDTVPSERELVAAAQENTEAEQAARKAHLKGAERRDKHDSSCELSKAEKRYRHANSRLNALQRQFTNAAVATYHNLIEEQAVLALSVKECLSRHTLSQGQLACRTVQRVPHVNAVIARFTPSLLVARLHHKLESDLQQPYYSGTPLVNIRSGHAPRRTLVGVDILDEERIENSLIVALLRTSLIDDGCPRIKRSSSGDSLTEVSYLETHWLPNLQDNVEMLARRDFSLRHSLIMLYLSSLPTPLFPMTNSQFTQLVLKQTKLHPLLRSLPAAQRALLRSVCDYVGRIAVHDERVIKQFGRLVLRVDSDLLGEASKERSIEGVMAALIRYFRKEKERTILDIGRSPTPGLFI